jgi:DNA (cytosine-5)-methyltransferase 1
MNHLDLFSGIGGFSIGLEKVGFNTIAFCEKEDYCRMLLQKHWKGVKIYNDIKECKGKEIKETYGRVDILTGGFPCQPYSVAGKQKGTADDRYLWPEMFRVIKEVQPTFVIAENVRGIINIQDGMVFETVCSDLESEGFEIQTFIIPAAGVGAPHKRERVWIVGYSKHNGSLTSEIKRGDNKINDRTEEREDTTFKPERAGRSRDNEIMENTRRKLHERSSVREKNEDEIKKENANKFERSSSESASNVANTKSEQSISKYYREQPGETSEQEQIKSRGSSSWTLREANWLSEPNVGRVVNGVPGRAHRLRGLGNAIVPKIAEEIGRSIMKVLA